jgi:hypothetical protein
MEWSRSFLSRDIGEPWDDFDRARHAELAKALASPCFRPPRKARKPTLVTVAKQADEAGIPVARYEVEPDGKINVVTGKPETPTTNPWLDDLKVTKQ